jgi:hypothetical protein
MKGISCNFNDFDMRKIVPLKWYYIFLPWYWKWFFLYKKRKLKAVFSIDKPFKVDKLKLKEFKKIIKSNIINNRF